MLLTKTVDIKWHGDNMLYYKRKGYKFTKYGDVFIVNVEELRDNCILKLEFQCEKCNRNFTMTYKKYATFEDKNDIYCKKCTKIINKKYDYNNIPIILNDDLTRKCNVLECENKYYSLGYCLKHYRQIKGKNEIYKSSQEANSVIIHDSYAEVIIYDKDKREKCRTQIDIDDINKIKPYRWSGKNESNGIYIITDTNGKKLYIQDVICDNTQKEFIIDHKDRDSLNNRKNNLRHCSHSQNSMNCSIRKNNTSGVTGVCWDAENDKWIAQIRINGKGKKLGRYKNKEDAIEVREKAELKYFKEFSPRFDELKEKHKEYYNSLMEYDL